MNRIALILFAITLTYAACDKVSPPDYGCTDPIALNYNPEATLDDGNCEYDPSLVRGCTDSTASNYNPLAVVEDCHCRYDSVRTVLVEDYTGFRCANCPRAAEALKDLECKYGARVVPLAVHITETFAGPETNSDGSFSTDFRTTDYGDLYETAFETGLFLPNGMVNRKKVNDSYSHGHTNWETLVDDVLAQPPTALVDLDVTYNEGSREATASVKISALNDLTNSPYRLVVLLSEDSVVDWQLDNAATPPEIEDYVHMHVLRDGFTAAWGDAINGGASIAAGDSETTTHNLTIDQEFVDHNCNVVAFIYRDDTKEVIQAEYKPVMEH